MPGMFLRIPRGVKPRDVFPELTSALGINRLCYPDIFLSGTIHADKPADRSSG